MCDRVNNDRFIFDSERQIYTINDLSKIIVDNHGIRFLDSKKISNLPIRGIDINQRDRALVFVDLLDKTKGIQYYSCSYGLKHRVEEYYRHFLKFDGDCYCSNGALIGAMIERGFDVCHDYTLNPCFNYSKASLAKIKKMVK